MKININDEVKVGDVTMFRIHWKMQAVEVIAINYDGTLKLMTCNLEYVWDRVDKSHWLRQVEFMKQLEAAQQKQYSAYLANKGTLTFEQWEQDGRFDKSL